MTTNIDKLEKLYNMPRDKAKKIHELFKSYLGYGYSKIIIERASKQGLNLKSQQVRNIKNFLEADLQILNLLLELANEKRDIQIKALKKMENLLNH